MRYSVWDKMIVEFFCIEMSWFEMIDQNGNINCDHVE